MYTTPRRCARCGYQRQPGDAAPDWQCPSCQVAYDKAEAQATQVLRAGRPPAPRGRFGIWIAAAILVAIAVIGLRASPDPVTAAPTDGVQPEVVMYATSWCGYCAKARAFFAHHGIEYLELDIDRDAEARQINERLGGGGVPTIMVGDQVVHGFDERSLSALLAPWTK